MLCPVQEGVRGDVRGQDGNSGETFEVLIHGLPSSGKFLHVDS